MRSSGFVLVVGGAVALRGAPVVHVASRAPRPVRVVELDLDSVLAEYSDDQSIFEQRGAQQHFAHGYERRADDDDGGVDAAAVDELLAERALLRKCRDFDAADRVRGRLRALGVDVDDRNKLWSRRRPGVVPPTFRPSRYAFAGDHCDADLRRVVTRVLARRAEAQFHKDWVVADHYRDMLRVKWGVEVHDRSRCWKLTTPGYSQPPPVELDEE